jgi:hypothetical protein
MIEFFRDIGQFGSNSPEPEDGLPLFSFIEPSYCNPNPNDAHPPHDMSATDALVASIYNASFQSNLMERNAFGYRLR